MHRFRGWFGYRKDYLTLAASIFISLILLFSNSSEQTQILRQIAFSGIGSILERVASLQSYFHLREKNSELRQKNIQLMLQNSKLQEAWHENERLREMLAFKQRSELKLLPCKVIGENVETLSRAVILDAGQKDGLKKNMAVLTADGLVGKVFSVTANHSVIQLLEDKQFRVSATIQRSRVRGIVKWQGVGEVVLAEVPKRSDVEVGDRVITSGLSTIFPASLDVAEVIDVNDEKQGMFMTVKLKAVVDFAKLEEVFVVLMRFGSY